MTALADLIARVEGLKGPDRNVDAAVECAVVGLRKTSYATNPRLAKQSGRVTVDYPPPGWKNRWTHGTYHAPRYTASLDAVVALIERELPGWDIVTQSRDGIGSVVLAEPKDGKPWGECIKAASSPLDRPMPLAYCLAFLRALESRGGER